MTVRKLLLAACFWLALGCESEQDVFVPSDPMADVGSPAQAGSGAMPMAGSSAGGSDEEPGPVTGSEPAAMPEPAVMEPATDPLLPFGPDADTVAWSTERFDLDAGQERYLCFAKTLEEDLVINGYSSMGDRFVHHLIFSRARAPEPEGFAECDIAFRMGWEPLFISGAGDTKLEFPADAGHRLTKGTQLIVQMHLLNVAAEPVGGALTIHMRRSSVQNPRPVSSYTFGTAAVELPAGQSSEVVGTCPLRQPVQLIAAFPHMHLLGTSLAFEVGASEATLEEVFRRDPFDFDDQRIEPLELALTAGQMTRVRCTFTNTLDQTVSYGESTRNEMCYLVGFAVDLPAQSACLEVLPPFVFGGQ